LSRRAAALGGTSGDERRSSFLDLAHKLGQLGDQCHETRRALHDLALSGGADSADENELTTTQDLSEALVLAPHRQLAHQPGWKRAIKRLLNLE